MSVTPRKNNDFSCKVTLAQRIRNQVTGSGYIRWLQASWQAARWAGRTNGHWFFNKEPWSCQLTRLWWYLPSQGSASSAWWPDWHCRLQTIPKPTPSPPFPMVSYPYTGGRGRHCTCVRYVVSVCVLYRIVSLCLWAGWLVLPLTWGFRFTCSWSGRMREITLTLSCQVKHTYLLGFSVRPQPGLLQPRPEGPCTLNGFHPSGPSPPGLWPSLAPHDLWPPRVSCATEVKTISVFGEGSHL